jgi:5-formyltetrahydrofolate cyclo-ligase
LTKAELRKIFLSKRSQLPQARYDELNHQLLEQFKRLDLNAIRCIHLFLPIHTRKEPNTFLIRDWLAAQHPHIQRVFPKADFADNTMQNYLDDEHLQMTVNAIGIPEPVDGNTVDPQEIDMVLIPLLAFDKQGYRVGYGKGFYDRFITQCRPDTRFVGLSFFEPVDSISDVNTFDQTIGECILPERIYKLPF